ncbi:hypothetical protein AXK58_25355 [Tsukamurella tyrosinosolvens]|nr:hypothetical protein AXK58_25355 [Tsukamurella tyrosinosolvens]
MAAVAIAAAVFAAPANAAPGHAVQPISVWTIDYAPSSSVVTDAVIADGLRVAGFTEPRVIDRLTAITRKASRHLSGDNPNAFSQADGTYGLLQLTPTMFARFHGRGTSARVYDPAANVASAWNYLVSEHGVHPRTGDRGEVLLELTGLQWYGEARTPSSDSFTR